MNLSKSFCITSVILAICLLNAVWAGDSLPKSLVTDVALSDGGTLQGQVVDNQNVGQPGIPVVVRSQDRDVAQTITTANGQFVVQDLRGGVYQVATVQSNDTFRLWAPRTAPPAARNRAIVYVQNGVGGLKGILASPIILPAAIATAIAVPIALSSHHQPASP